MTANRKVLRFHELTDNVTWPQWTTRQIVEAFPFDAAMRYLIRDRESIDGEVFEQRVECLGIEEVVTASRSPRQNPIAERFVGTSRREYLRRFIILSEQHLKRLPTEFLEDCHESRAHQGWTAIVPSAAMLAAQRERS